MNSIAIKIKNIIKQQILNYNYLFFKTAITKRHLTTFKINNNKRYFNFLI